MVIAHLALGLWGVSACFLPMLLVRNAARRYIELRRTQEAMLWNTRMAAMGEMQKLGECMSVCQTGFSGCMTGR